MAEIIAITNQKGGIGKTTTAIAMASILTQAKRKTLLIDTDAQCNASDTFGAKVKDSPTLYDVLLDGDSLNIRDAIQHTQYVDIVAGDPLLRRADSILASDIAGAFRLKQSIENIADEYEYIFIDTAPMLGEMLKNALIAANRVLIPVSADRYAIQGLSSVAKAVLELKKTKVNPNLSILGLVLVAYPVNTIIGQTTKEELMEIAPKIGTVILEPPIRRTIKVQQAHAHKTPLIYYDNECTAAKDYYQLTQNLFLEGQ